MSAHENEPQKPELLAAELLASAKLDRPSAEARERALRAGLDALPRRATRRKFWTSAAAMTVSLGVAAGGAVYLRAPRERPPEVRAEPAALRASASSAPPLRPCPEVVVASGSGALLEDWEHPGAALRHSDGRSGAWLTFDDDTAKQSFPNGAQLVASLVQNGRSRHALHLRGGHFTDWGVVFGTDLATGACYDGSAYAGVEFWAKGPARIQVGVQQIDVQSPKFGGFCEGEGCYNSHRKSIELDKTWRRYVVRWDELRQLRPGGVIPFDVRRMRFLEFAVLAEDTPFDIWVDDVSFLPRER